MQQPVRNFFEQFASAAARFPDRTAIEVQRKEAVDAFTYRRLDGMSARIGSWLAANGVTRGDRCAILAENDAHWCAVYLGILRIGAIAVPLDTAYKAPQVARLLTDCQPRLIVVTARHLDAVVEGRRLASVETPIALVRGSDAGLPSIEAIADAGSPPALAPCPASPSDPAVILYTSGTTSDPKGVVLTHANLLAEREGVFAVLYVDERDCVLGVLPLFHALAQMANLLLPFSVGARVVFLETLNTTELLRALGERGVTAFACVPQFFYLIHQRVTGELAKAGAMKRTAFKSLLALNGVFRRVGVNAGRLLFGRVHAVLGGRMRLLITGGSRFDPAIGADLYRMGFNILQAYGLTETSGAATLVRPGDRRLETVGQALPGSEVRVLPPDASIGAPDGEVLIKGPVVMAGYYNRPDATADALRDGWLHTGDLGRLDAEGRLTITGRKKELIVLSSGKNIYPEEIEAHYRQSPVIKELCVLGLARPGEPSAERLYAVVVPDPDVLRERKVVNAGDLVRFEIEGLSVGLPAHKRVLGYEVWMDPLPRTTTGKTKRFEVERRVREREQAQTPGTEPTLTDADRRWSEDADVAPMLQLIQAAAREGRRALPDANLELDLGLDSMERVELLTALEQRFGADVPEEDMQRLFTVRELVEAIARHRTAQAGAARGAGAGWDVILESDPGDAAAVAGLLGRPPIVSVLSFVVLRLVLTVARLGMRIDAANRHLLPAAGPYLISPNHQSYLDVFVLVGVLPYRIFKQLFFVGASEYFQSRLTRWLARQLNVVPVDPDASLVPAMQAGAFGLRRGRILVLFPEGERSIDGSVKAFKKGAGILAEHLQVPIVPVAIDGLYDIWPRNRSIRWSSLLPWRRTRVAIRFGEPMPPPGTDVEDVEREYAATVARLRATIESMWNEAHATRLRT
jgi:long-chain acyl-CoA synthetase